LRNPIEEKHPDVKFDYYTTIDDFLAAIKANKIVGRLIGGFDVGRRHNTAEFMVFEELKDDLSILRLRRSFRNEPFEVMKGEAFYALRNANIRKLGVDATGPGIQLAEEAARAFPGVCEEINFTNSWKDEAASNIRRLMECQWLALPDDRDFRNQFHSIKRIVTEHGNLRIDAEANTQHHGDIVWGCALACMYIRNRPQINFGDSLRRGTHMDESNAADIHIVRPGKRLFAPISPMVQQPIMSSMSGSFGLELPAIARRKIQHA
jgi:phage FluMu gp28-like protein